MPRSPKAKSSSGRSEARREELRRNLPKPTLRAKALLQRPDFVGAIGLLLAFTMLTGLMVNWSRDRVKVSVDQIMHDTRVGRVDYQVEDVNATAAKRTEARDSSPRIYQINESWLERLRADLTALPVAVEGKATLDEIIDDIRVPYGLTEDALLALQPYSDEGKAVGVWKQWVANLVEKQLVTNPLIAGKEYQNYMKSARRVLVREDGNEQQVPATAIERPENPAEVPARVSSIVRDAGFPPRMARLVQARLLSEAQDIVTFDPAETERRASVAAESAEPVLVERSRGDVIYRRGDALSAAQYQMLLDEADAWRQSATVTERWLPRLGLLGVIGILVAFVGSVVMMSYPRIQRNPLRIVAICLLMSGMLAVTTIVTVSVPRLLYPAAIAPTLFVSIILLLSYDRRLAIFLSTVQCALIALALEQGVGWFVVLMAGCGAMIVRLPEVRNRNSLIQAAMGTAAALGAATALLGLFAAPWQSGTLAQIISNSAWSVASSLFVGFLVLGMLPSIEKTFDITTGMTLAELRDPSQPLLRQLQQRAPGSYNHSLQVATIAEAATDAIGADSLLVYVGALYHDIGKMNKPQYFVENQAGGFNKHEKLRPAMSLLVIIGHVKDGIELAREYGLPRTLIHFIESHHGTTLVEYFYHAAKEQAEADQTSVEEVEFRYPGPRPRTKEAAILMLSDAVESATRAMAEPHPSRIESLVRELSRKRLLDGQFDECDLTFRELGLIEDAITARLCAIHHGRIAYPKASKADEVGEEAVVEERKSKGA